MQNRSALVVALLLSLSLSLSLSSRRVEAGKTSPSAPAAPHAKKNAKATSALAQLRSIGESVARALTQKKYEELFSLLCAEDQTKTTKAKFAATLREVHEMGGTTSAEVGAESDFLRDNRRAGVDKPEDLEKLSTVLVPIRLHATDVIDGRKLDGTSVQDWVFRREKGGWCTPLDD